MQLGQGILRTVDAQDDRTVRKLRTHVAQRVHVDRAQARQMQRERQRQDHRVGALVRHDGGHDLLQKIRAARHLRGGIDGVAGRCKRHQLQNLPLRLLAELRQSQPDRLRGVGEQHAEAARCGEDRNARPLRQTIRQQDRRGMAEIDQLVEAAHAHGAAAGKQRVEHRVRSRHGAGMRGRSGLPGCGRPDLHGDDRLAGIARLLQRGDQPAGIAAGFETAQDHLGGGIARHPGDAVGDVDVALVARGDEPADADTALAGKAHGVAAEISALRDDAERAGGRHAVLEHDRERRDALLGDADRTEAVRPQQPHAMAARRNAQPLLHGASMLAEARQSPRRTRRRCGRRGRRIAPRLRPRAPHRPR